MQGSGFGCPPAIFGRQLEGANTILTVSVTSHGSGVWSIVAKSAHED